MPCGATSRPPSADCDSPPAPPSRSGHSRVRHVHVPEASRRRPAASGNPSHRDRRPSAHRIIAHLIVAWTLHVPRASTHPVRIRQPPRPTSPVSPADGTSITSPYRCRHVQVPFRLQRCFAPDLSRDLQHHHVAAFQLPCSFGTITTRLLADVNRLPLHPALRRRRAQLAGHTLCTCVPAGYTTCPWPCLRHTHCCPIYPTVGRRVS